MRTLRALVIQRDDDRIRVRARGAVLGYRYSAVHVVVVRARAGWQQVAAGAYVTAAARAVAPDCCVCGRRVEIVGECVAAAGQGARRVSAAAAGA